MPLHLYTTESLFFSFPHSLLCLGNSLSLFQTQLLLWGKSNNILFILALIYPLRYNFSETHLASHIHSLHFEFPRHRNYMLFVVRNFYPLYLFLPHCTPTFYFLPGQLLFILKNPNWIILSKWKYSIELLTSSSVISQDLICILRTMSGCSDAFL